MPYLKINGLTGFPSRINSFLPFQIAQQILPTWADTWLAFSWYTLWISTSFCQSQSWKLWTVLASMHHWKSLPNQRGRVHGQNRNACSTVSGSVPQMGQSGLFTSFLLKRYSKVGKAFWQMLHIRILTSGGATMLQIVSHSLCDTLW